MRTSTLASTNTTASLKRAGRKCAVCIMRLKDLRDHGAVWVLKDCYPAEAIQIDNVNWPILRLSPQRVERELLLLQHAGRPGAEDIRFRRLSGWYTAQHD